MADDQAWAEGWQLGADRAAQYRAHKQALADQERELNVHDLLDQRTNALSKINDLDQSAPDYADRYQKAHDTLQGINSNIIDAYHPAKNPGAIEQFGHLLTDHLGITNGAQRAQQKAVSDADRNAAIAKQTDQQIAASPLTGLQKLQIQEEAINRNPNLDDEGKKRAIEKLHGITPYMKPDNRQYKLLDGTIRSFNVNDPNEKSQIPEGATEISKVNPTTARENIEEYNEAVKKGYKGTMLQWTAEQRRAGAPSTSAFSQGLESYSVSHGFPSYKEMPEEYRERVMDYNIRKQALDKAYPTATTTTSLKQNFQGQFVPVTETNYKTPQGAVTLRDPLWFLAAPVPGPNDAVQQKKQAGSAAVPATTTPVYTVGKPQGLVAAGNIDVNNRPVVPNGNAASTVLSMGIEMDGKHYLIPRVSDGKDGQPPHVMTEPEATDYFKKYGEHLGEFNSDEAADSYAKKLHEQQETLKHDNGRTVAPPSVKQLKKEAATRAPTGSSSSPSNQGNPGNVRVGNPIFAAPSKDYRDALAQYNGAKARVATMEKNARDAYAGDQQAMLSLVANHIGMTLGAQKGARINQAVWNEAVESAPGIDKVLAKFGHFDTNNNWVLDTPFDGYKGGVTLTGGQIKSMVKLAHEQENTFRDNVKTVEGQLNSGVSNPSKSQIDNGTPSPSVPKNGSKGVVSIAKAKLKPAYQGMTDAQIKTEIENHNYTAVP